MEKYIKRFLALLLVLCVAFIPLSGVFATDGNHITVDMTKIPSSAVPLETGELYTLRLDNIFTEPNSGHTLSYSVSGANLGTQTHIAYPNGVPTLVFTVANIGNYTATVRATCSDNDYAEFNISFAVTLASDGTPNQYGYDETSQSSVSVYVTISNDGMPIMAPDGTVIANLEVEVPYFDLNTYGLSDYYRFGTTGGSGEYTGSTVIARPTALHLYLYLLETYLTDGNNPVGYTFEDQVDICYMDGTTAYTVDANDTAVVIDGQATSLYLTRFWGHDCNLMYYRNHVFPLMSPGWGATCDYALLSDGDVIEIAMFSDWSFYSYGAFLRYDGYDKYASCSKNQGQTITVNTQKYSTAAMIENTSYTDTTEGLTVKMYKADGSYYGSFTWVGNSGNTYTYTLPNSIPTGMYYVVAMETSAGAYGACMAPAVMTVDVVNTSL